MDRRGRLETRAAFGTLLVGVPAFIGSALAVPVLAGLGLLWAMRGDFLVSLWALAGGLVALRAVVVAVEALGQLWWWRLAQVLAMWVLVGVLYPGWWITP